MERVGFFGTGRAHGLKIHPVKALWVCRAGGSVVQVFYANSVACKQCSVFMFEFT